MSATVGVGDSLAAAAVGRLSAGSDGAANLVPRRMPTVSRATIPSATTATTRPRRFVCGGAASATRFSSADRVSVEVRLDLRLAAARVLVGQVGRPVPQEGGADGERFAGGPAPCEGRP